MKKNAQKCTALFLLSAYILVPSAALAEAEQGLLSDFFNPDYILSDADLNDVGSMNVSDIQSFLNEKGGAIARMSWTGEDFFPRGAAEIIAKASRTHRINPKYLLVKLQKEQSLVTEKNPSEKQLDWATGYGICDACRMDDPALQKHKGFPIQVDSAAAIMRWYADHAAEHEWIKRPGKEYQIDGTAVVPKNAATAFLYTYTPHIRGNQNFWMLWQTWFQSRYPDGSLLKSAHSPTVYVVRDGKKRPIKNMAALVTRYDPAQIITVSESELGRYEDGPIVSFPNFSILNADGSHYLLDDDILRPFESESVVRSLGYHPDEVISVSAGDIADMKKGAVIAGATHEAVRGKLVQLKETGSLYFLKDGSYHAIYDMAIAKANFPALEIERFPAEAMSQYARGEPIRFKDGALIGVRGYSGVYVVEHGKKRRFANEDIFTDLGYKWQNIVWIDGAVADSYPAGEPVYLEKKDDAPASSSTDVASRMFAIPDAQALYVGERIDTAVNTYLVADAATGAILAGKNIDTPRAMASFAKVMTGYRLYQEKMSEERAVPYAPDRHKALYDRYRLVKGEAVKNKDLLSALLVSSLNTPARILVSSVEKNEKSFVARMNTQAKTWGMKHTRFTDPAGVNDDNTTTARDYLTLWRHATKHPRIHAYLSSPSYTYTEAKDVDGKPGHFDANTNALFQDTSLPFRIVDSKTGYLEVAGSGLAMTIERPGDKKQFVIITMGNPDYQRRFDEPRRIATWAVHAL